MINTLILATSLLFCHSPGGALPDSNPPGNKPPAQTADDRHAQDVKNDAEVGKKYAEQVEKEYKVSKNADYQAKVKAIGSQFADIANHNLVKVMWGDPRLSQFEYHFMVLEGPDVNAFSLPGGYIFVYEGLLKFCETDDELAGVLAHEVSHAAFRHLATLQREQSKMQALTLPLILITILSGGRTADLLELNQLVGLATGSGWSQKAESAADYGGFQFMMKSRYNPVGMLTFMERLASEERSSPNIDWGIFRTHPPTKERADALMEWMNDGNIPIRRSQVTTTFKTTIKPGKEGQVEAWFGGRKLYTFTGEDALARADKAATKIDAFMDGMPELFDIDSDSSGTIYGKGNTLFTVTPGDAKAKNMKFADAVQQAVGSVKKSLAILGYRVWDAH